MNKRSNELAVHMIRLIFDRESKVGIMSRRIMKILIKINLKTIIFFILAGSISAYAQNFDGMEARLSAEEKQRLQQLLDKQIEPTRSISSLVEDFSQKDLAAFKLGDVIKREANLREWSLLEPPYNIGAKWRLMYLLMGTEKRAEAFSIGRELIQVEKFPPSAIRIRVSLANEYITDSALTEAFGLLSEAENILKNQIAQLPKNEKNIYWINRAQLEFLIAQSRGEIRQGKWQKGIESARQANEKAKDLAKVAQFAPDEAEKQWTKIAIPQAPMELATSQILAGVYSEAEWTLRETYAQSKELGLVGSPFMNGFFNRVAMFYNTIGSYNEAMKFSQQTETNLLDQGYQKGSPVWMFSRMQTHQSLIGLNNWTEVWDSFQVASSEAARIGKPLAGMQLQSLLRTFTAIKINRNDIALRIQQAQMVWLTNNFGEDHYFTAINRGLMAVALWKTGDAERAKKEFERASRKLTAPDTLTGDFIESALEQKIKRFVLQSYMQLLAQTAHLYASDAETIFQIADQLNEIGRAHV